ncbi:MULTISPECIES: PepSY domain-containing protein [unclassified Pseudomonas]|uniref:PepSY-associated TM helix domain-containing protein n=1 Tax=unclassified Pseudomonas TaxID=196821 RepID=UPI000D830C85|nr:MULTISPECIES: PepSY-associated TM helix domain-containing protein [unclassified Pseudomonas]PYG78401.1 putative iron-regulated membrane protein [Pseudomonas sp. RV120224-01c]PYG82658.1 putative iron-regulated membrane protein [Pseudomonas sp. RV120224-01b]
MFDSVRQAMLWAHRVLGLGFSALLLIAFFMGSLALYDRELDSWMLPALRVAPVPAPLSLDQQVLPRVAGLSEGRVLQQWYVELPDARRPLLRFQAWSIEREGFSRFLLPGSDGVLAAAGSRGGDFFYRLHYTLNINAWSLGARLLGLAAMVGLIALIAGVYIHARLFQDLFTLRADKAPRRLLDLHNLTGVLALPFHALILLSGLLILFPLYLPAAIDALYPGQAGQFAVQANAAYSRPAAGTPGPLASLDGMLAQARQQWGGGEPAFVRVWHPGDANAYVEVSRSLADRVSLDGQTLYFEGANGRLLHASRLPPTAAALDVLAGLHVAHFHQPGLRALYFFAGLSGCVMLASGLLYWLAKRRLQQPVRDRGAMAMALLCSALITGMPLATLAMLVANRCLPLTLRGRADWEVWIFFAAWLLAGMHALWAIGRCAQARAPWAAQCLAISALALLAVLSNAWSTGDHPCRALSQGLWSVAGVDLALLASALLAGSLGLRLRRRAAGGHNLVEVKDA